MSDVRCQVYTPQETMLITGLSRGWLMSMIKKGELRCGKLPDGPRRYWKEDVKRLMKDDEAGMERIREMDEWNFR